MASAFGTLAFVAAVLCARGLEDLPTIHASLYLWWCLLALASGTGFYLRWKLTGEAPVGLLAAALVAMSLPQLPLALIDVAADPSQPWRRLGPMTRLVEMAPAAWLMIRCVRSPEVDSALRPVRLALGYAAAAIMGSGVLVLGQTLGWMSPQRALAPSVAGYAITALTLALAWLFARHARSIARPLSARIALIFAGLALCEAFELIARRWWHPLVAFAGFLAVVLLVLLVLTTASLLRSALDFTGLRMFSLSLRAEAADDAAQREEERMHELRSTVAGIRQASGTLNNYGQGLAPDHKRDLQEMMAGELGRLERLLTSDAQRMAPGPVMLDDLIRPLVVSRREQGTTVQWRPTGACALARADEVAEILNVLLTNAYVHAAGSPVEIAVDELPDAVSVVVRDHGPGVPSALEHDLFDRGTRHRDSSGQGLGLHIARRLAADSGGVLSMLRPPEDGGARFELRLGPVPDPPASLTRSRSYGLGDAG